MSNCRISHNVKLAAIKLHEHGLLQLQDILECCDFSKHTFHRILKLWCEIGNVVNHTPNLCGWPCLLDHDDLDYLLNLVCTKPDYFLDELLSLVKNNRFISVHFMTIFQELEHAGMSWKKLHRITTEHNDDLHATFIAQMAQYEPQQLGFVDETSKDACIVCHHYGWSQKGHNANKKQVFVQGCHTFTEALLSLDGIVAATVIEGSMTQELFLEWLENNVVSERQLFSLIFICNIFMQLLNCEAYPSPGLCMIMMDNAKIHHGAEVHELFDCYSKLTVVSGAANSKFWMVQGVCLEYLPPYLPDLNPIEEAFSTIKHWLCYHQEYYRATQGDEIIWEVLEIITPDNVHGYFLHPGYF